MKLSTPHVRFQDCEAGWIRFTITVGHQTAEIHASHIYDPFLGMLHWLKRIVSGKRRASFTVNQESFQAEFVAVQKDADTLLFGVREIADEARVLIRKRVDKRRLVKAFYGSFMRFARSTRYVEEQWAYISLGDRLASALPKIDAKNMVHELAALDRDTLRKMFFHVAPSYEASFEGEETDQGQWDRFLNLVLHSDSEEAKKGLIETPIEWKIPAEFDTWPISQRTKYLRQKLRASANHWLGRKLNTLSSPLVEGYLTR